MSEMLDILIGVLAEKAGDINRLAETILERGDRTAPIQLLACTTGEKAWLMNLDDGTKDMCPVIAWGLMRDGTAYPMIREGSNPVLTYPGQEHGESPFGDVFLVAISVEEPSEEEYQRHKKRFETP